MEKESCCRLKAEPRDAESLRSLQNRISRMKGQLDGIGEMLTNNRYCGDILIQISALESALRAMGYEVLREHLEGCVSDGIRRGDPEIIGETMELIKRLK